MLLVCENTGLNEVRRAAIRGYLAVRNQWNLEAMIASGSPRESAEEAQRGFPYQIVLVTAREAAEGRWQDVILRGEALEP